MKNIAKYVLVSLMAVSVLSCDDYLDELPDNRTEIDTEDEIQKLLVSAYPIRSEVFMFEMMSDNTDMYNWNLNYSQMQENMFFWREIPEPDDDAPYGVWPDLYRAVAAANTALKNIDLMPGSSKMKAAKGEALICRAYNHFLLANTFCLAYGKDSDRKLGLPYVTEPETTVFPEYERGTLQAFYENINRDIEAALPLIENNPYSQPKYHFNKRAAYAFAAQFNLFYGRFDKAIGYATAVLGDNPSNLLRDWGAYGALSVNGVIQPNEYIDAGKQATLLVSIPYSNWSVAGGNYSSLNKFAHSRSVAEKETIHSKGPWGNQNNIHVKTFWNESVNKVIFRKVGYYFEYTDPVAGIGYRHSSRVHFTTDETLLTRAEAYILSGQLSKGYEDISTFMNGFSTRTPGYSDATGFYRDLPYDTASEPSPKKELNPALYDITKGGDQEYLLHYLLHVKRILTLHEGQRWMDVKRYGITVYRRLCDRTFEVIDVMDTSPADDLRRAIQLPSEATSAGMEKNPR